MVLQSEEEEKSNQRRQRASQRVHGLLVRHQHRPAHPIPPMIDENADDHDDVQSDNIEAYIEQLRAQIEQIEHQGHHEHGQMDESWKRLPTRVLSERDLDER